MSKKYCNQLSGVCNMQKLVKIHNTNPPSKPTEFFQFNIVNASLFTKILQLKIKLFNLMLRLGPDLCEIKPALVQ